MLLRFLDFTYNNFSSFFPARSLKQHANEQSDRQSNGRTALWRDRRLTTQSDYKSVIKINMKQFCNVSYDDAHDFQMHNSRLYQKSNIFMHSLDEEKWWLVMVKSLFAHITYIEMNHARDCMCVRCNYEHINGTSSTLQGTICYIDHGQTSPINQPTIHPSIQPSTNLSIHICKHA